MTESDQPPRITRRQLGPIALMFLGALLEACNRPTPTATPAPSPTPPPPSGPDATHTTLPTVPDPTKEKVPPTTPHQPSEVPPTPTKTKIKISREKPRPKLESIPAYDFPKEVVELVKQYAEWFPHANLPSVLKYARMWDVEPEIILALITKESTFRPSVESGAGATGLMQVMPVTGIADFKEMIRFWTGQKDGKKAFVDVVGESIFIDSEWQKILAARNSTNFNQVLDEFARKYLNLKNPEQAIAIGTYHIASLMKLPELAKLSDEEKFKFAGGIYNKGYVPIAAMNAFRKDQEKLPEREKKPVTWENVEPYLQTIIGHSLRDFGIASDFVIRKSHVDEMQAFVRLTAKWVTDLKEIKKGMANGTFGKKNVEVIPGPLVVFDSERPKESLLAMYNAYQDVDQGMYFYLMTVNLPDEIMSVLKELNNEGVQRIGAEKFVELYVLFE